MLRNTVHIGNRADPRLCLSGALDDSRPGGGSNRASHGHRHLVAPFAKRVCCAPTWITRSPLAIQCHRLQENNIASALLVSKRAVLLWA